MKKATFTFVLDEKTSEIVAKSLLPESKRKIPRTKVEIKNKKGKLVLNIMADDVSALRAGINSYLRWIKTATDMIINE
jgi:tRNA threonylcarbamoyladenosine modification (KEOPS) complex  Pcc1 subunit